MKIQRKLAGFSACALVLSSLTVPVAHAASTDFNDIDSHWAKSSIERWAGYEIVNGFGNNEFKPEDTMTRAQMAQILSKTLGLTATATTNPFTDVSDSDWFKDAILKCNAAGIMNGTSATTANPNAQISRQDAVTMMGRALGIEADGDSTTFDDNGSIGSWAVGFVNAMAKRGIVNGRSEGVFAPTGNIKRGEIATILDRAITTYVNTPDTEVTATGKGITLIAASGVTVKGEAEDILVAPAATGTTTLDSVKVSGVVTMQAANGALALKGATTAAKLNVPALATGAKITVEGNATVAAVNSSADDVAIDGNGSITNMTVETGKGVTVAGSVKVGKITNNSADTVKKGNTTVAANTTWTGTTTSGGGGGGGGGGSYDPPATTVTITADEFQGLRTESADKQTVTYDVSKATKNNATAVDNDAELVIVEDTAKTLNIDLANVQAKKVTVQSASATAVNIKGTASGDQIETLTLNTPEADVTTEVTVGTADIVAVGGDSYHPKKSHKKINMKGKGHIVAESANVVKEVVVLAPKSSDDDQVKITGFVPELKISSPIPVILDAIKSALKVTADANSKADITVQNPDATAGSTASVTVSGEVAKLDVPADTTVALDGATVAEATTAAGAAIVKTGTDASSVGTLTATDSVTVGVPVTTLQPKVSKDSTTSAFTVELADGAKVDTVAVNNANVDSDTEKAVAAVTVTKAEGATDATVEAVVVTTGETETIEVTVPSDDTVGGVVANGAGTVTAKDDTGATVTTKTQATAPANTIQVTEWPNTWNTADKGTITIGGDIANIEYKKQGDAEWKPATATISDLSAGVYLFRTKGDGTTTIASEPVSVAVETQVGVSSAEIQGTAMAGKNLTAVANADATGTLAYKWTVQDVTLTSEQETAQTLAIPEGATWVGKTITVAISNYGGNDGKTAATSTAVTVVASTEGAGTDEPVNPNPQPTTYAINDNTASTTGITLSFKKGEQGDEDLTDNKAAENDKITVTATSTDADIDWTKVTLTVMNGQTSVTPVNQGTGDAINTWTFTMPAATVTVTATIDNGGDTPDDTKYAITDGTADDAGVTLSFADSTGDLTAEDDGTFLALAGTVTVTATPDPALTADQKVVLTVMNGSEEVTATAGAANTWTFTMPAAAVTVTAKVVTKHIVNVADGNDETVTPDAAIKLTVDPTTAFAGDTVTVTATAADGAVADGEVIQITVVKTADGTTEVAKGSVDANNKYTFEMPDEAVTVSADAATAYTVAQAADNATDTGVTLTFSKESAAEGDEITVTATADPTTILENNRITLTATGVTFQKGEAANTWTFTMPGAAVEVTVALTPVFAIEEGTPADNVTLAFTVNGETVTKAAEGETVTVTATGTNATKATIEVKDANGGDVTANGTAPTWTFTMPAAAVTVTATVDNSGDETEDPTFTVKVGADALTPAPSFTKDESSTETSYVYTATLTSVDGVDTSGAVTAKALAADGTNEVTGVTATATLSGTTLTVTLTATDAAKLADVQSVEITLTAEESTPVELTFQTKVGTDATADLTATDVVTITEGQIDNNTTLTAGKVTVNSGTVKFTINETNLLKDTFANKLIKDVTLADGTEIKADTNGVYSTNVTAASTITINLEDPITVTFAGKDSAALPTDLVVDENGTALTTANTLTVASGGTASFKLDDTKLTNQMVKSVTATDSESQNVTVTGPDETTGVYTIANVTKTVTVTIEVVDATTVTFEGIADGITVKAKAGADGTEKTLTDTDNKLVFAANTTDGVDVTFTVTAEGKKVSVTQKAGNADATPVTPEADGSYKVGKVKADATITITDETATLQAAIQDELDKLTETSTTDGNITATETKVGLQADTVSYDSTTKTYTIALKTPAGTTTWSGIPAIHAIKQEGEDVPLFSETHFVENNTTKFTTAVLPFSVLGAAGVADDKYMTIRQTNNPIGPMVQNDGEHAGAGYVNTNGTYTRTNTTAYQYTGAMKTKLCGFLLTTSSDSPVIFDIFVSDSNAITTDESAKVATFKFDTSGVTFATDAGAGV